MTMTIDLATKTCSHCGEAKPLSQFPRNRTGRDGIHHYCKPCARDAARAWQESERERMGDEAWRAYVADSVRRSRKNNPAVRARGRLQQKAYSAAQRRLRENHQAEFDAIYAQERYERGL